MTSFSFIYLHAPAKQKKERKKETREREGERQSGERKRESLPFSYFVGFWCGKVGEDCSQDKAWGFRPKLLHLSSQIVEGNPS